MTTVAQATAPASYYEICGSNDAFWRCTAPAAAIGAKTFLIPDKTEDGNDSSRIMEPNDTRPDCVFPWRFLVDRNDPTYYEVSFPEHEGAAVWHRPDASRTLLACAMRGNGIRVLGEVDDNYTGKRKNTVYMRANKWSAKDRQQHLACLAEMDAVVFSTEWLRDVYAVAFGRILKLHANRLPELHVCRNHVPDDAWPERVERDGPLRVGWMGSPSHMWDVNVAWNAMLHARRLGCETWMIGYNPCVPWGSSGITSPGGWDKRAIQKWRQVEFNHVPWVRPDRFKRFALPLDIGLCPLIRSDFTDGKSDVKALEYAIAGAAVIASDTPVYNRTLVHGETALLVRTEAEMAAAVELLVRDESLRMRLVNNLRQYVWEERGSKQLREEWLAAISG